MPTEPGWLEPIHDVENLYDSRRPRDGRIRGVAEYGITVRWDKNFLKLIRLLQRREEFALFGGVRFGGTLEVDDAFALVSTTSCWPRGLAGRPFSILTARRPACAPRRIS
jgi:hypothetical protein